jgi:hypothetical protein
MLLNQQLSDAFSSSKNLDERKIAFIDGIVLLALANRRYVTLDITPTQAHKFEGDFYGLLNELGIEDSVHYVNMRMNLLNSSSDFHLLGPTIKIIERQFYDDCMGILNSKRAL